MIDTIPGLGRLPQQQQRQQQRLSIPRQHDMEDGELMEEDGSTASAPVPLPATSDITFWTPLPPFTTEPPQRPPFKGPQRPSRPDVLARNKSHQALHEDVAAPDPDFNMLIAEYQLQKARTEEKTAKSGQTLSGSDIPGLGHASHFKQGSQPFQPGGKASYMTRQNPPVQNTRL